MMRVLVVEDEEMIRKGIVLATDWQSLGCVVVGEAANGEEGIAQAEKSRPSPMTASPMRRRPFGWERWIFCSSRFMTEIWKTRCLRCRKS